MFDCAGRLACRALWLLFLLEYKRVCKSAVTNTQSRYCYLVFSRFSEGWAPFSQKGFNLEQFIIGISIPALLPFFMEEIIYFRFQIGVWDVVLVGGQV